MVIDTSALVASFVEASMVLQGRRGDEGVRELDLLIDRLGITVAPVTRATAECARDAFRQYGKGRHPAALNFGDCFSYALAVARGESPLFVGNDFSRTNANAAPY